MIFQGKTILGKFGEHTQTSHSITSKCMPFTISSKVNFEEHNNMAQEGFFFMMKILQNIKEDLPYGRLRHCGEGQAKDYPQPEAFQTLGALSNYIQEHAVIRQISCLGDFEESFGHAVSEIRAFYMFAETHDGIVDFVCRLHDCLRFADLQTRSVSDLDACLLQMQMPLPSESVETTDVYNQGTYETRLAAWTAHVAEWRIVCDKWTEYIALFHTVVPQVFWDIPAVLTRIIEKYPKVFWAEFWKYMAQTNRLTEFRQYLISTVASKLLLSDSEPEQEVLAREMLQDLINSLEKAGTFGTVMSFETMCEALIETGLVLYPSSVSFGVGIKFSNLTLRC